MSELERFAIIGHPVAHSLSPQLYEFFMKEFGAKGNCIRATGLKLQNILKMLHNLGIHHINVTHPFKEIILKHVVSLSPEAKSIGAVNTVSVDSKRQMSGHNTDHEGIRLSLFSRFQELRGTRVLIIGAGGAGRAAAFALSCTGAEVEIANRDHARGRQLAKDFSFRFRPLENISSVLSSIDILVWTIPGYPVNICPSLAAHQFVLDANYNFEPEARYFGNAKRIDGLNWLIYQGWKSYCLFSHREADLGENMLNKARQFLQDNRHLRTSRPIALIGFMGAGKTTVGKQLAAQTGWEFLDTDKMCEAAAGKTISSIFYENGENEFRRIEKEQIEIALKRNNAIISLGGGALMTPGIAEMLKKYAFTVWLYQSRKTIRERCLNSSIRPMFDSASFGKLMKEREPFYLSSSDLIVDSEGGSVEEICDFMISEFSFLD